MKANEINIRDPFILLDDGKYYMYGSRGWELWGECTGLDVYVSSDLVEWSEPITVFERTADFWANKNYWAPEVHKYRGEYYMLATFKSDTRMRGTQILKASSPTGPFLPHSDGPLTPYEWSCLDGTLYVENGTPYMIFCHEWMQIRDGEMCAVRLTDDLRSIVGEPRVLFHASDMPSATDTLHNGFITDGPFMHRTRDDRLVMIWASFNDDGYTEVVSYSDNGSVNGNWLHCEKPLSAEDGGHGMLFFDKESNLYFTMHRPNEPRCAERVHLFPAEEIAEEPFLKLTLQER